MSKSAVLVVDDAQHILLALQTSLRGAGNDVDTADTAQDALAAGAMRPPTPSSSISFFRRARTRKYARAGMWRSAPLIVLSAVGEERQKVTAHAGADDYVTNPVGIDELLARLRAVLRRTAPSGELMIRIGGLVVDLQKRAVSVGGEPVDFAPRQYDTTNLLHVNVSQLRRKLAGAGGVTPLS